MTASFASFVFDPDDSVEQRVFQCACGASTPANRTAAQAAGWRRTWRPALLLPPPPTPSAVEPPRPEGLLHAGKVARKWTCPECTRAPEESYVPNPNPQEAPVPTERSPDNVLLFPAHVLGVRPRECNAPSRARANDPRPNGRRVRFCSLFSPLFTAPGPWASTACGQSARTATSQRRSIPLACGGVLLLSLPVCPVRGRRRCVPVGKKAKCPW